MTVEYTEAIEAEKIGKALIKAHHKHLSDVRIEYLFRDKAAKSGGKETWGKTKKVSGLHAYMSFEDRDRDAVRGEPFFIIELAKDVWDILDKPQREALLDHELCHCSAEFNDDGDVSLQVTPHDLEEFNVIVERRGLWRKEVERFVKAAVASGQLTFSDDDDDEEKSEGDE